MHQEIDRTKSTFSTQEMDLVKAIFEGRRIEEAIAQSGMSKSTSQSVLQKAVDRLLASVEKENTLDSIGASATNVEPVIANLESEKIDEGSTDQPEVLRIRISPLAYFRSMLTILWTSLRYPFRTTEIDLTTGRVVRQY